MGFYDDHLLPHILNFMMDTKQMEEERKRCLAEARGTVLEVGFGTGLNLPHYPVAVTKVVGVDPSATSAKLARKRIEAAPFPVEVMGLSAGRMPVADGSFDSIVCTFTLCTIPDAAAALLEMRRVLGANGHLYFVEHGHAEDPKVARWQERLNGIQRAVCGGCNLNRPIGALVEGGGFEMVRLETGYMEGAPRFGGFLYRGVARRGGS
jgi:ubiquinone/menaquinone biosynthesis C-methylase UbiE